MASAVQKITLTSSRDISFSNLSLSKSNVRRIVAGVSMFLVAVQDAEGKIQEVKAQP